VSATTNAPKGTLTTTKSNFTFTANDQITEPEQFDETIIAYHEGAPIRVRDVGTTTAAAADRNAPHCGHARGELMPAEGSDRSVRGGYHGCLFTDSTLFSSD
jgi:hypothetical protein